jgi:hypothetical protein
MFVILYLSLPDPHTLTVLPPSLFWLEPTGPAPPPCATRLMRSMVRFSRRSSSWCVVCLRVEEARVYTRKTYAVKLAFHYLPKIPRLNSLSQPPFRSFRPLLWALQTRLGCSTGSTTSTTQTRRVHTAQRTPSSSGRWASPSQCSSAVRKRTPPSALPLPSFAVASSASVCLRACACVCARFVAWRCNARACRAARSCERGCSARRLVEARECERMQL